MDAASARDLYEFSEAERARCLSEMTRRILAPEFRFPTLPCIANDIMALLRAPDADYRAIDRVVRSDPVLAARVLAVANSSLFRPPQLVTSLRTAMMIMGWNALRDVLWQVLAESHVFRGGIRSVVRSERNHAVTIAHLSRVLCRRIGDETEHAFVCGLLHDLGRPLCYQALISSAEIAPPRLLWDEVVDSLHPMVGHRVAEAWNLPPVVALTILHHHDFDTDVLIFDLPSRLPLYVACAERIAQLHESSRSALDMQEDRLLRRAELTVEDVHEVVQAIDLLPTGMG